MDSMFVRWLCSALLLTASTQFSCVAQELSNTESPAAPQSSARDQPVRNVLFLVSCSYPMGNQSTNGLTRIALAKQVVAQFLTVFPNDIKIGLRTYGQGQIYADLLDCRDTKLIEPIGPNNKEKILEDIEQLQPRGINTLGYAVNASIDSDFKTLSDPSLMILITDKVDPCGANISRLVKKISLVQHRKSIKIYSLGLYGHPDKGVNALIEFAKASGGRYYRLDEINEFERDIQALCNVGHAKL
jgi:hypothetical protein